MSYRCILLDFDGTLVDTIPAIQLATRMCFAQAGLAEPDEASVRAAIADGVGLGAALTALNPAIDQRAVPQWITSWRRFYNEGGIGDMADLFPGAMETLEALKGAGVPLVAVSNKGQVALEKAVRRLQLAGYFCAVIGESPGLPGKPDPEAFALRISPVIPGITSDECLMVGDSEADLLFANNIGSDACYAAYGYGNRARCLALSPRHVIAEIQQLPEIAGLGS